MIINLNFEGTPEEWLKWKLMTFCCDCHPPAGRLQFSRIQLELPSMSTRIIKGTQPNEIGTLKLEARDAEGSLTSLPTDLVAAWETTDAGGVNAVGDPNDVKKVELSFGTPNEDGTARPVTITGMVNSPSTGLQGVIIENFVIVGGDAANVIIAGLDLPGLPAPEPDAPPPPDQPTA